MSKPLPAKTRPTPPPGWRAGRVGDHILGAVLHPVVKDGGESALGAEDHIVGLGGLGLDEGGEGGGRVGLIGQSLVDVDVRRLASRTMSFPFSGLTCTFSSFISYSPSSNVSCACRMLIW